MENQILYTALVTPFSKDGKSIDYKSLENILKLQEKASNGILLLGSTGESLSMSFEEKKEIMKFACNLKLNTQIMVGVPNHNLQEAIAWIEFCNSLPISGYLCATPLYTKPGILGQIKWFETLLNKAHHKVMLYNIPGRTAVKLYSEVVKELAPHDKFISIKDCGGSVESFMEYKLIAPSIKIYCGDDYLLPSLVGIGAFGSVSIASNAWPFAFKVHIENVLNGIKDNHDRTWWNATHALFKASNPIPIKALMKYKGLITEDAVRLPLCKEDLDSVSDLIKFDNVIENFEV